MRYLAIALFFLYLLFSNATLLAHGGEDHGDSKPKASTVPKNYFTATAVSDVYELLIKY